MRGQQLLAGAPAKRAAVQAALHVVAVHAAGRAADDAVVAAGADGDGRRRGGCFAAQLLRRRPQPRLAERKVREAPGVGGRIALVRGDDICPVALARLGGGERGDARQLHLLLPQPQLLGAALCVALAELSALLVLDRREHAERAVRAGAQQPQALGVVRDHARRRAVAAAEAQQPRRRVGAVEDPLLYAVVGRAAHQQRLAREEVQRQQRPVVRVAQQAVQPALVEVPHAHDARAAAGRHQRQPRPGAERQGRHRARGGAGARRKRAAAAGAEALVGGAGAGGVVERSDSFVVPQVVQHRAAVRQAHAHHVQGGGGRQAAHARAPVRQSGFEM